MLFAFESYKFCLYLSFMFWPFARSFHGFWMKSRGSDKVWSLFSSCISYLTSESFYWVQVHQKFTTPLSWLSLSQIWHLGPFWEEVMHPFCWNFSDMNEGASTWVVGKRTFFRLWPPSLKRFSTEPVPLLEQIMQSVCSKTTNSLNTSWHIENRKAPKERKRMDTVIRTELCAVLSQSECSKGTFL